MQIFFFLLNVHVHMILENNAMPMPCHASRSSLLADRFHTETGGRFEFTWYRCKVLYQSEILAPVQEPGWTHSWVTRAGITFCGGIV